MWVDPALLEKADPRLQEALREASGPEPLRVVAVVGGGAETAAPRPPEPEPGDFADRRRYREFLIEQRRTALHDTVARTLAQLADLGLATHGGSVTHTVVLDGPASAIARALALPDLRSATLDHPITLERPARPGPGSDRR